jgi:broad specificity phosphatase PhoE
VDTRLYLIRHGETDWNRRGIHQGTTDVPLNDDGRAQAAALAEALRGVAFDAAYTSPLSRAVDTARIVLGPSAVPLVTLPGLRELSYGLWQGRGAESARRCDPGLAWRWRERPWEARFPGGESLDEVSERGAAAVDRIAGAHGGGEILVSGHGHLNRVLLIHLLGLPRDHFWSIDQPNACCTVVTLRSDGATAESIFPPPV